MFKYNYSNNALLRPNRFAPFSGHEKIKPVDVHATAFNLNNAWWLSNFSHLAYFEGKPLEGHLTSRNLKLIKEFKVESTYAYLAEGKDFYVLAFRGTETPDVKDFWTDIDVRYFKHPDGYKLHNGFYKAYNLIKEDIASELKKLSGKKIIFTGHSLGAALSILAAYDNPPDIIYTYGSPRVGDKAFAEKFNAKVKNMWRITNCSDVVCSLPPPVKYKHCGTHKFINHQALILTDPSSVKIGKQRSKAGFSYFFHFAWLIPGNIWFRSFADHTITNYSATLGKLSMQEQEAK